MRIDMPFDKKSCYQGLTMDIMQATIMLHTYILYTNKMIYDCASCHIINFINKIIMLIKNYYYGVDVY